MTLSSARLEKLSEISKDIGLIFFASLFVEPLLNKMINLLSLVIGVILAVSFFILSLLLTGYERY